MEKLRKKIVPIRKVTVIAFCISVIVLILTYTGLQWLIVQREENNFMDELEVQTKESLSFAKFLFDGMIDDLEVTANVFQEYDDIWHPEAKEKLNLSQHLNFCDVILVSDTEGNAYEHNGIEINIAYEDFFQQMVRSQNLMFSEILPSDRYDAIQIISFPIYSNIDPQKVKGYLFGLYDVNKFFQSIDAILNNNQYIYIVDSEGTYITTFAENQVLTENQNFWDDFALVEIQGITLEELKENFDNHIEGEFAYSYEDIQRYGYHMPLGIKDWQIVCSMEKSIMDSHVKELSQIVASASIINWACLAVMLWSVYSYFKNTNKEIWQAHQRISKSNEIMKMAVEFSNRIIFEYDIIERKVELKTKIPHHLFDSIIISEVPEGFINMNAVADSSIAELRDLFEQIKTQANSQADIQLLSDPENPTWYRISLQNIYSENGEIISTVGSAEDISLLKQGEAAIKRKEELHKTLIRTSILYARVDLSTGIICELNGKETNQSYPEYLEENVHKNVCVEHHSYVMQALSLEKLLEEYHQGKEYVEVQYKIEKNHEIRWVSTLVYRIHESEGSNVTVVVQDIDEKKRTELALKERAEIDGLTGLYNAATTRSKIGHLLSLPHLSEEKQLFILFDLDNFKKINDTFGHAVGDQVLIDVATKLKNRFRSTDILGRLGGDEFIVMLCDVNSDHYLESMIQSLSVDLLKTYTQSDISITISASIGIAVSPQDGITFEELYKRSDAALYEVKKSGKNGYRRWAE